MSHINFDFLTESFLFGYGLEDNFSALSDYELEKELKTTIFQKLLRVHTKRSK